MAGKGKSSSGHHRSAITGRYVSGATAARHPRTTVTERSSSNHSSGTAHRSAVSGRYVTSSTASRHPRTTITENR